MEAFEAILSIVIIALAVHVGNKKKKAKQIMESIRQEGMPVPSDHAPDMRPAPVQYSAASPAVTEKRAEAPRNIRTESINTLFAEGEDPCHDDMFAPRDETGLNNTDEKASLAGQELVRGFVLGEILAAPKFKTMRKK